MSVKASLAKSTMTSKEMTKMFLPIVLFSIILPLVDIVTDLRLIIQLYSGAYTCGDWEKYNVSYSEWEDCLDSDDMTNFCQQYPMPKVCVLESHSNFATMLFGKYTNIKYANRKCKIGYFLDIFQFLFN